MNQVKQRCLFFFSLSSSRLFAFLVFSDLITVSVSSLIPLRSFRWNQQKKKMTSLWMMRNRVTGFLISRHLLRKESGSVMMKMIMLIDTHLQQLAHLSSSFVQHRSRASTSAPHQYEWLTRVCFPARLLDVWMMCFFYAGLKLPQSIKYLRRAGLCCRELKMLRDSRLSSETINAVNKVIADQREQRREKPKRGYAQRKQNTETMNEPRHEDCRPPQSHYLSQASISKPLLPFSSWGCCPCFCPCILLQCFAMLWFFLMSLFRLVTPVSYSAMRGLGCVHGHPSWPSLHCWVLKSCAQGRLCRASACLDQLMTTGTGIDLSASLNWQEQKLKSKFEE